MLFSGIKLPKPLSKEELTELFLKYRQGDLEAREKIIIHSIRLVITIVKRFSNTPYDLDELIAIGNIGLIKAVDAFNIDVGTKFSTYTKIVIENEIKLFLSKNKKHANHISLDQPVYIEQDGKEITLGDTLSDISSDFVVENEEKEVYRIVRMIVNLLPEREKNVIMKYFGFENNQQLNQPELASELGISQSYISKVIIKTLKEIKKYLELLETGEMTEDEMAHLYNLKKQKFKKRKKDIYGLLDGYSKEEVDFVLSGLPDAEKELIRLKYGDDLANPSASKLTKEENHKFYSNLIPRIKTKLKQARKAKLTKTAPTMNEMFAMLNDKQKDVSTTSEAAEIIEELVVAPVVETPQNDVASNGNEFAIQEAETESVKKITKEDFVKISALLNLPVFINLLDTLTPKEAIVAVFSFGYIDGKYFSIEAIANFLGVSKEEVVEIIQKVVQIYKENVTQSVDKVLKITNKKS